MSLKIVFCLPDKLAKKLKAEIPRGHRSDFIIDLLNNHFNKNEKLEDDKKELNLKRLVSVKHFTDLYPAFTPGSVRYLIHNEEQNGFHKCVKRIRTGLGNKKIVIDLDAFEKWINSQK